MDDANIMRSKVMEVFNSCSNDIKSNFTLILSEVKRWIKGLRSQSDDQNFQKYIANKFRHHMEFGSHNEPLQDIDDIGDRILQWGFQRDRLRAELKQNFPQQALTNTTTITSVQTSSMAATKSSSSSVRPARPTVSKPTSNSGEATTVTSKPTSNSLAVNVDLCYVCGKRHPPGCALKAHPDANHNPNIAWKDSPSGKAIVKIKGPKASIDIKNRLDKNTGLFVPLDDIILAELRKHLPPGKGFQRPGQITLHNIHPIVHDPVSALEDNRPPCCAGSLTGSALGTLVPAILQLRLIRPTIHVLIDTGCLQTNIISSSVAALLERDGGSIFETNIVLTAGVGGTSYGVQGIMNLTITFPGGQDLPDKHLFLRAILSGDVSLDLIIGLPSIKFYDLLPILNTHIKQHLIVVRSAPPSKQYHPQPHLSLLISPTINDSNYLRTVITINQTSQNFL